MCIFSIPNHARLTARAYQVSGGLGCDYSPNPFIVPKPYGLFRFLFCVKDSQVNTAEPAPSPPPVTQFANSAVGKVCVVLSLSDGPNILSCIIQPVMVYMIGMNLRVCKVEY